MRPRLPTPRPKALPRLVALALTALPLAPGCGRGDAPARAPRHYASRGVVRNVARPEGRPVLLIHHERMNEYVGRDGKPKAMASMTMPFGVTPSASLDGIAPDDKIEFTFSVDWSRYPAPAVESLRKLPPDTPLELAKAE